jgi:hypothetical protein
VRRVWGLRSGSEVGVGEVSSAEGGDPKSRVVIAETEDAGKVDMVARALASQPRWAAHMIDELGAGVAVPGPVRLALIRGAGDALQIEIQNKFDLILVEMPKIIIGSSHVAHGLAIRQEKVINILEQLMKKRDPDPSDYIDWISDKFLPTLGAASPLLRESLDNWLLLSVDNIFSAERIEDTFISIYLFNLMNEGHKGANKVGEHFVQMAKSLWYKDPRKLLDGVGPLSNWIRSKIRGGDEGLLRELRMLLEDGGGGSRYIKESMASILREWNMPYKWLDV